MLNLEVMVVLLWQFFFPNDHVHTIGLQILLQYYIERQCLLKCIRRILMHACMSYILFLSSDHTQIF